MVALRLAAMRGLGLVCAPSFMVAAELKSGQLLPVMAELTPFEFSIDALYPNRRHIPAKVRSFIDFAAKHFTDDPSSCPASELAQGRGVIDGMLTPEPLRRIAASAAS